MPLRDQTSVGTEEARSAAARITRAMTRVAERDIPHWQLCRSKKERLGRRNNVLDQDAVSALQSCVCEGHGLLEAVVNEVLLAVRPLELEVVHWGSS